jgi:hypothetical protein
MTPGQLVKAMSIALDVPEEVVVQHDRNLVVAGLRTTGARGRNAPHVTPLDAARLFVATLGSVRTKDSVQTVKIFEKAIVSPGPDRSGGVADIAIQKLPTGHNLIEGLAAVIAEASQPIDDLQTYLKRFCQAGVICTSGGFGVIGGLGGLANYHGARGPSPDLGPQEREEQDYCQPSGISQTRLVAGTAVMLLGAAFRDNGLRYANPRAAYLDGYGTKGDTAKKPAKKSKKVA